MLWRRILLLIILFTFNWWLFHFFSVATFRDFTFLETVAQPTFQWHFFRLIIDWGTWFLQLQNIPLRYFWSGLFALMFTLITFHSWIFAPKIAQLLLFSPTSQSTSQPSLTPHKYTSEKPTLPTHNSSHTLRSSSLTATITQLLPFLSPSHKNPHQASTNHHSNPIFTQKSTLLILFLLSLIYTYNPFTLERLLMGHFFVLWGQAMIWPAAWSVLRLWRSFTSLTTSPHSQFLPSGWLPKLLLATLWVSLLGWTNIHHWYMLALVLGWLLLWWPSYELLTQALAKHFFSATSSTSPRPSLTALFQTWSSFIGSLIIVFTPSLWLRLKRLLGTPGTDFYLQKVANSSQRDEIIRSFSLDIYTQENLFAIALSGSGSWMRPFEEISQIKQDLGSWQTASLHFNDWLLHSWWLILLFTLGRQLTKIQWKATFRRVLTHWKAKVTSYSQTSQPVDQNFLRLWKARLFLGSLLLISASLTLGYTTSTWETLNQWFYELPGSYSLREPGKIFSLFISLLLVWLILEKLRYHTSSWNLTSQTIPLKQATTTLFVSLTCFSFLLPFIFLNENYNYIQYPQMIAQVNHTCHGQKVLYLPHNTYLTTHYSPRIFVTNLRKHIHCPTVNFITSLGTRADNSGTLELTQTQAAQRLQHIQKQAVQENNLTPFLDFLKSYEVRFLLIETYDNELMTSLNKLLQTQLPVWQQEETMYGYQL